MRSGITTFAAAVVVVLAQPAAAHHSCSAEFDSSKLVTLAGEVVMMEWVNPHSWLRIDVKKHDGFVDRWKDRGRLAIRPDAPGMEPELAACAERAEIAGVSRRDRWGQRIQVCSALCGSLRETTAISACSANAGIPSAIRRR